MNTDNNHHFHKISKDSLKKLTEKYHKPNFVKPSSILQNNSQSKIQYNFPLDMHTTRNVSNLEFTVPTRSIRNNRESLAPSTIFNKNLNYRLSQRKSIKFFDKFLKLKEETLKKRSTQNNNFSKIRNSSTDAIIHSFKNQSDAKLSL